MGNTCPVGGPGDQDIIPIESLSESAEMLPLQAKIEEEAHVAPESQVEIILEPVKQDATVKASAKVAEKGRAPSPAAVAVPDDDIETNVETKAFVRPRKGAVSSEPVQLGYYREPFWNKYGNWERDLFNALEGCLIFEQFSAVDLKTFVRAMEIHKRYEGEAFDDEGVMGDGLLIVLEGSLELRTKDKLVSTQGPGSIVEAIQVLWPFKRQCSIIAKGECVAGKLRRTDYVDLSFRMKFEERQLRQYLLKCSKLFEMMEDEQIAKIADVLELRIYEPGSNIVSQGEEGKEMYILEEGEAHAWARTGKDDVQELMRYFGGELFGEKALVENAKRFATITADKRCRVLVLAREQFERILGLMSDLQAQQYLTDPRKLIADFYDQSDSRGPRGSLRIQGVEPDPSLGQTSWFAVYRPTSPDAIARMLSGKAVGKGLNVKGKSAKKGVLSGFVPFVQISDNKHKSMIEASPSNNRLKLYYKSRPSRDEAHKALLLILNSCEKLKIDDKTINLADDYQPDVYGLELPEPLLQEAYIQRPDLSPMIGWETGRKSEPAYMDMNLHAIRGESEPKVVLFQNDESEPMNPRGLLVAYAEKYVRPVVSDFDTFTVGSKGMEYSPLPADQVTIVTWALDNTMKILGALDHNPWTSRWLDVLKTSGFHPHFPKFGYGDPTSYRLIGDVVAETSPCGAVRHGAECCNFYFPQELDDEFLVVWRDFPDKPWAYKTEEKLRAFLLERIADGFICPINPVWPVRDPGWYDVFKALTASPSAQSALKCWYPPEAGIIEQIEEGHKKHPKGFRVVDQLTENKK